MVNFIHTIGTMWNNMKAVNHEKQDDMRIPGCISGGADWAVANNYDVMLTTELQKFWLREIWMTLNLLVKEENAVCIAGMDMEIICAAPNVIEIKFDTLSVIVIVITSIAGVN